MVGSGAFLLCSKKCKGVKFEIQGVGYGFEVDLFIINIKGSDVILGVQWIKELGAAVTDYRKSSMGFADGEEIRFNTILSLLSLFSLLFLLHFNLHASIIGNIQFEHEATR